MDKYTLPLIIRKQLVQTQIEECQKLIYRNNLNNIAFKKKNDEDKMIEVETNNKILMRELDGLFEEQARLEKE